MSCTNKRRPLLLSFIRSIKGTQVYDSTRGGFTDVGILDVQQIFGRAGRPQFDDSGEACIITTLDKGTVASHIKHISKSS